MRISIFAYALYTNYFMCMYYNVLPNKLTRSLAHSHCDIFADMPQLLFNDKSIFMSLLIEYVHQKQYCRAHGYFNGMVKKVDMKTIHKFVYVVKVISVVLEIISVVLETVLVIV